MSRYEIVSHQYCRPGIYSANILFLFTGFSFPNLFSQGKAGTFFSAPFKNIVAIWYRVSKKFLANTGSGVVVRTITCVAYPRESDME